MKKSIFTLLMVFAGIVANAQTAYSGKGDTKFQIGANFQSGGTGIITTFDYGIGENISIGLSANYTLGYTKFTSTSFDFTKFAFVQNEIKPEFIDRADIRARFNANLGNVINVDEKFDVYPGLDFGLKNFGAHLGARYFFTEGFGVYTEAGFPIAKYDSSPKVYYDYLNNQFNVSVGMSFNL